jgi:hypothetical protein
MIDYCLLLSRGYAAPSSLKLVGDHFELNQRQRLALMRCACSDQQLANRRGRGVFMRECIGKSVAIDGYNILITLEAALGGAPIFIGRDGAFRDLSGIHGTYRKVQETIPAAELAGHFLSEWKVTCANWWLDSPVSNSGRLKVLLAEIAQKNGWDWNIQLSTNPDKELSISQVPVASSDSIVIDACKLWLNISGEIISSRIPHAWLIDLSTSE